MTTTAIDATDQLHALLVENNVTMLEVPEDGPHHGDFHAYSAVISGTWVLIFPAGQPERLRLELAKALIARGKRTGLVR